MVTTLNCDAVPVRTPEFRRVRVSLRGAVQGVGFRPFVFRLAQAAAVRGWVGNTAAGVIVEAEGLPEQLEDFLHRLERDRPPRSFIQSLETTWLDAAGYTDFKIRASSVGDQTALVMPDIATCPECLAEIFAPANRRFRYPFTNCTHCGPRYSILEALPYDRANTTMKRFTLCAECAAEYEDPADRRFHAQPNACPNCGPHLELWDGGGQVLAARHEALVAAAAALRQGQIVALKGLGGFQLLVDGRNGEAVRRLRERKHREEKPLALMFPSLAMVRDYCAVSVLEERLLGSPESPIVLMRNAEPSECGMRSAECGIEHGSRVTDHGSRITDHAVALAPEVAPGNPYLGVMLPYTPLHHLLMAELRFPIVATSGNLSDEPICLDEHEALERLQGIADVFLVHNRPIVRQVDDSVARVLLGRELVLRRARGYAPLPVHVKAPLPALLAVGGHLKSAVAISKGQEVFVSQHIGDLETSAASAAFQEVIGSLGRLYGHAPVAVVHDLHPDYRSSLYARARQGRAIAVQHHYAHVRACMAENELEPPVLGIAWDGTGYGLDGNIWGGEFLHVTSASFQRLATVRPFRLPGGDLAVREPRRTALGLLYELFGKTLFTRRDLAPVRAFEPCELDILRTMLERQLNAPLTTSAGRLFDAVASLCGRRQICHFEGQAAMELEFALPNSESRASYPCRVTDRHLPIGPGPASAANPAVAPLRSPRSALILIDWEPMIWSILEDLQRQAPVSFIAAKFHNTLAEAMVEVARLVGEERVVLSGGCFQNAYLLQRAVTRLAAEGFRPYWHQRIPPNDGGLALGQILAAAQTLPVA